jgi:uncharacterized membrane protein YccF (DUF307 family)
MRQMRYYQHRRHAMRTIANAIWFVLGGWCLGLGWALAGLLLMLSIVGLPWARASFVFAGFCFLPFGREAISRKELTGQDDLGTGTLGLLGNVVWFLVAGLWLAIGHLVSAVATAVTIIGIPFAVQHLKLAGCALAPVGKTVVSKEVAAAARRRNAVDQMDAF